MKYQPVYLPAEEDVEEEPIFETEKEAWEYINNLPCKVDKTKKKKDCEACLCEWDVYKIKGLRIMKRDWKQKLNPNECQTRIYFSRGLIWRQCTKRVKVEVGGKKYCAIHSPQAIEARRKKADEKYEKREEFEKKMKLINAVEFLKSLGYKIIPPPERIKN